MYKKNKLLSIFLLSIIFLFGCKITMPNNSQSVTLTNLSSKGATNSTLGVNYQEEDEYKEKYTDILVKCDQDNKKVKIALELDVFCCIRLEQKNVYYSLTKLIANAKIEKTEYVKYKDAISKSYVMSSEEDINLTFVAVIGDLNEQTTSIENVMNISNEVTLELKKPKK